MANYKQEFPAYDRELWIPDGFEDCSCGNDMCPHVEKDLGNNLCACIWQNYESKRLRELPIKLYVFEICTKEGVPILVYPTDDKAEVLKLLEAIDL